MFCLLRERNKFMVQKYAVIQRENSLLFQRRGKVYYSFLVITVLSYQALNFLHKLKGNNFLRILKQH